MQTIEDEDQLALAIENLIRLEPRFRAIHEKHGLPPLRRMPQGLESLLRIVTDQLISLSAGEAIWRRLDARLAPFAADAILASSEHELRQLGLTGAKARTFLALAHAERHDFLDSQRLGALDDNAIRVHLMQIAGIGPWTAEIYLLSALGRTNAWPAGDIALRAAAASLFCLPERPDAAAMQRLAEPWKPWRSVAARFLWVHYRVMKGMPPENIPPSQGRHTRYSICGGK